jgi:hypothetical protein
MEDTIGNRWRTSSYSGNGGGNCVETGVSGSGRVLVRDTKDCDGGSLAFTADAWATFTVSLK